MAVMNVITDRELSPVVSAITDIEKRLAAGEHQEANGRNNNPTTRSRNKENTMNATKVKDTKPLWWVRAVRAVEEEERQEEERRNAVEKQQLVAYVHKLVGALERYGIVPTAAAASNVVRVGGKVTVDSVMFRLTMSDTLFLCVPCDYCGDTIDMPIYGGQRSLGELLRDLGDNNYHVECSRGVQA